MRRTSRFHRFTPEWELRSNLGFLCGNYEKQATKRKCSETGIPRGKRTLLMGNRISHNPLASLRPLLSSERHREIVRPQPR